jgi:SAM-dependent methyltransferase
MDPSDPAYRGQADYTRGFLKLYDPLVLGLFTRVMWRVSTPEHVRLYREHIGSNHLDVGPGTGYFLDHAGLPDGAKVTILDPNQDVLDHVTRRLRRLDVTAIRADALKPLPMPGPFDSAALSFVLHCLPGPMERKGLAIRNISNVLTPDGVFFGGSILGREAPHGWLGRRFLSVVNRRGAFDNLDDTEAGLREILQRSFRDVDLRTEGGAAIFVARGPIHDA